MTRPKQTSGMLSAEREVRIATARMLAEHAHRLLLGCAYGQIPGNTTEDAVRRLRAAANGLRRGEAARLRSRGADEHAAGTVEEILMTRTGEDGYAP